MKNSTNNREFSQQDLDNITELVKKDNMEVEQGTMDTVFKLCINYVKQMLN